VVRWRPRASSQGVIPCSRAWTSCWREPVRVAGRLHAAGERAILLARLAQHPHSGGVPALSRARTRAGRRYVDALFTEDPDALEDPSSYPLAPDAIEIDLRPAVPEELLLALPRWVVCREDCRGLCPRCGKDLNAGPCGCPPAVDQRWKGWPPSKTSCATEKDDLMAVPKRRTSKRKEARAPHALQGGPRSRSSPVRAVAT